MKKLIGYRKAKNLINRIFGLSSKKIIFYYRNKFGGCKSADIKDFIKWSWTLKNESVSYDAHSLAFYALEYILRGKGLDNYINRNSIIAKRGYSRERDRIRAYKNLDFKTIS